MVISIFYDLSAAFDVFDLDILIKKLNCIGIRDNAQKIMETLLRDRKIRVRIEENTSTKPVVVNVGVCQGNNTANIAFLPFINDLVSYVRDCEIGMFADDFVTTVIAKNINEMKLKIDKVIGQVQRWCEYNK